MLSTIKNMPHLFKFLWGINVVTFVPILLCLFIPWTNATYELNGQELTYAEFWQTGFGPIALLFTLAIVFICYATFKGKVWSRIANFGYWAMLIGFISYGSIAGIIFSIFVITGLWYYYFKSEGVNFFYQTFNDK